MNTVSVDYRFILENDNSPLIVFNSNKKIVCLNSAAEILLGYVDKKELFELALSHAPQEYGSRTTQLDLEYGRLTFYAINVSYNSDEWIAIHLYYRPQLKNYKKIDANSLSAVNINILLEAAISLFGIKHQSRIQLFTDSDLPPFKIDQNNFSKLLRKSLNSFRGTSKIEINLKMAIGEFIILNDKRYHLVRLSIKGTGRYNDEDDDIKSYAENLQIVIRFKENSITMDIPFIEE